MHIAGSVPYPWPYDGRIDGSSSALLICGAQRELVDASSDAAPVRERLATMADAARGAGWLVVWIRHGGRADPSRATASLPVRGTDGWQLAVAPGPGDEVVDAGGWDGCFGSDLDHLLRGRAGAASATIALGGFASEITVDSTVRTLNDRGHECLVLTDGCAPLDPTLGERAHASVTMSGGIFGALGRTDLLCSLIESLPPNRTAHDKETAA